MITVLTGNNSFEIDRERGRIEAAFDGQPEHIDGSTLELSHLPELLAGATLFASQRLVIIKNLSENTEAWAALPDWLTRLSSDINLVLIEPKLDKRTKLYKELEKQKAIHEFTQWTQRDASKAEQWLTAEAKQLGVQLDRQTASLLVQRSMTLGDKPGHAAIDQWRLWHALSKIVALGGISKERVDDVMEPSTVENVFDLFDAALRGNRDTVARMLQNLKKTEEPHRLFGLLAGQVFQLAALSAADTSTAEVARAIGGYPSILAKIAPYAKSLGRGGVKKIAVIFADADYAMKTTGQDPWLLVERALMKMATKG